jgi:peptide/nickel transport system substrate-binding protein
VSHQKKASLPERTRAARVGRGLDMPVPCSSAGARSVLLAVVIAMLAACGGTTRAPAGGAGATEPQYGGTVILARFAEPVLFNSLYSQDTASSDIEQLIFAYLMYPDETLEMVPHLAADYPEVSANGTVWTFRLRPDVRFHDGMPLTAHDVAFTYRVLTHPDYTGPHAARIRTLARAEAVGDHEVRFTFSEPDARFLTVAGEFGILPQHLLEHVPVAELGDYRAFNVQAPIGAGPFRFRSWTRGQNLVLEANEDYFEGRPYLDGITFRFVTDQSAGVLLLETGAVDQVIVPITEVATVERMRHVTLHQTLSLRYDYIGWNLRNPLFQDRRVRQALTHAIDREEIVDTLMEGQAVVAHAPVSPLSWAYNDDVPVFPYDPDRARALLAEAGWRPGPDGILQRDGRRFSFQILTNDGNVARRDLGVIVQQYLRAVGIELRPAQMEWGAFLDRILPPNYNFDALVLAWGLAIDPEPSAIWHSREIEQGLNNISFRHRRVDELADRNIRVMDQAERAAMLREVWQIIAEEQPYTFLFYPKQFVGLKSDVRGFVHHPRLDTYGMHEWWLDR